ncbi:MAG: HNH endonuclease [Terriglobales bacterium]
MQPLSFGFGMDALERRRLLRCFRMPNGMRIKSRASSMRNVFVAAIVPAAAPAAEEIRQVLGIFGLEPERLWCSYCGGAPTEWDHLRPLVLRGRPTGFPSSIRNLVPACGKCNQSKGNKEWRVWIRSGARWSPATLGRPGLERREQRLEAFEAWARCMPIDIAALVPPGTWGRYYRLLDEILAKMGEADAVAAEIARATRAAGAAATGAPG